MGGNNTNYLQHKRVLDAMTIAMCPREKWLVDLAMFIKDRQKMKEQIVVMADFNEHVINLKEVITDKLKCTPPTTNKGTKTIDRIFTSFNINVINAGYSEFRLFDSDHRALWIDVKESNLLGFKSPDFVTRAVRRLQCGIPSVKKKWKELYTQQLCQHNLFNKQLKLENAIHQNGGKINEEQKQRFEKSNRNKKHTEKRCRKLKMGKIPYSPETAKAQVTIELWQAVITKKKGRVFSSRKLRQLEKKAEIMKTMNKTLKEAEVEFKMARKKFWECKKNAKYLRQVFLERRAQELAREKNTTKEAMIKQLQTREKQQEAARTIKFALNKLRQENITTLYTKINGQKTELTVKYLIDQACLEENLAKYTQAEGTICTREPIKSLLGRYGDTDFCERVLNGDAPIPEGTPQYVEELFTQLRYDREAIKDQVSLKITTKEFQNGWKKMIESTSAGQSGIHFGNFIACADDNNLSKFESSIVQIPFVTGYLPYPWKEGSIVMIKKRSGEVDVSALRSLVLLEADYNFNNKILGRRSMLQAESINAIAPRAIRKSKREDSGRSGITQTFEIRYCETV